MTKKIRGNIDYDVYLFPVSFINLAFPKSLHKLTSKKVMSRPSFNSDLKIHMKPCSSKMAKTFSFTVYDVTKGVVFICFLPNFVRFLAVPYFLHDIIRE